MNPLNKLKKFASVKVLPDTVPAHADTASAYVPQPTPQLEKGKLEADYAAGKYRHLAHPDSHTCACCDAAAADTTIIYLQSPLVTGWVCIPCQHAVVYEHRIPAPASKPATPRKAPPHAAR